MFYANKRRSSFPRSAWERILDTQRPLCCMSEKRAQGTQSFPYAFPRRAWERVGMISLTAMGFSPTLFLQLSKSFILI